MDIYCDLEIPTDPEIIGKIEKRFSYIYGEHKPIDLTKKQSNCKPFRLIDYKSDWRYEGKSQTLKEYMQKHPLKDNVESSKG